MNVPSKSPFGIIYFALLKQFCFLCLYDTCWIKHAYIPRGERILNLTFTLSNMKFYSK